FLSQVEELGAQLDLFLNRLERDFHAVFHFQSERQNAEPKQTTTDFTEIVAGALEHVATAVGGRYSQNCLALSFFAEAQRAGQERINFSVQNSITLVRGGQIQFENSCVHHFSPMPGKKAQYHPGSMALRKNRSGRSRKLPGINACGENEVG